MTWHVSVVLSLDKTLWELTADSFLHKSKEMCTAFCTPFAIPGVEFVQCMTNHDYWCVSQIFAEEFLPTPHTRQVFVHVRIDKDHSRRHTHCTNFNLQI